MTWAEADKDTLRRKNRDKQSKYFGAEGDVMVRRTHQPVYGDHKAHQSGYFMSKSGSVLYP